MAEIGTIKPVSLEEEVKSSYLDYAMSVIVSRALPDVRDGLKPVQRRILYGMHQLGLSYNAPYKKSARIVGEVLGKYHPHGDAPVYEAMVRMAQDFSMRYPLIDGQGNFGSLDNDPPAAMRYTEARLARIAEEMLAEIDKDVVDFVPNFDASATEPVVLPARFPNLLLNGAAGIAVGMATNIPPHNLGEICEAIVHLIDHPEATVSDLMNLIPGPDFPGGALILGKEGIKNAYATGRGKIVLQAQTKLEEVSKGRYRIVVTELPYQVNKAALVERIAELVRNKRIDGIAEIRDESDREGIRIVIELRKDSQPRQVLNNLYKYTAMRSAFFVNMLALIDGQPRLVNLKTALQQFIKFRRQVITRRSQFELRKARDRAHILEGLMIALNNLDGVIALIRASRTPEQAREGLMKQYQLSQAQAQAILEMQLRRLAHLERQKVEEEYTSLLKNIAYLEDLLANPRKIDFLIREETLELKSKYADERRTKISEEEAEEFSAEDLIPHQPMVIILSRRGYIKRLPTEAYRIQRRGGRGVAGVTVREADDVRHIIVADTHDELLFFTNRGRVFRLKCHRVPQETSRASKGVPLVNLISIQPGEQITTLMPAEDFSQGFAVLATARGEVKKSELKNFAAVRSSGVIAMDLEKDDELVSAVAARDEEEIILVTQNGQSIRFRVAALRAASRTSGGVRGIRLGSGDQVVALEVVQPKALLFTITANGFGKLTPIEEYRRQGRGGSGMRAHRISSKTGPVVDAAVVFPSHELVITTREGTVLRTLTKEVPIQRRNAQGVRMMKLASSDEVASVACLDRKRNSPREELG